MRLNNNLLRCISGILLTASFSALPSNAFAQSIDAFWSHGNSTILEVPENLINNGDCVRSLLRNRGWGAIIGFGTSSSSCVGVPNSLWVHTPVPTPVLLNNVRSKVIKILVSHKGTATINAVRVYDGNTLIGSFTTQWTGDHLNQHSSVALPNPLEVKYGLSVSLRITNNTGSQMEIASVGADFQK